MEDTACAGPERGLQPASRTAILSPENTLLRSGTVRASEIEEILWETDAAPQGATRSMLRLLGPWGGGRFHSYTIRVRGDVVPYVAKFPSHEEQPDHTLLVELAAARLGSLFDPPVVPAFAVMAIRQELVLDVRCSWKG